MKNFVTGEKMQEKNRNGLFNTSSKHVSNDIENTEKIKYLLKVNLNKIDIAYIALYAKSVNCCYGNYVYKDEEFSVKIQLSGDHEWKEIPLKAVERIRDGSKSFNLNLHHEAEVSIEFPATDAGINPWIEIISKGYLEEVFDAEFISLKNIQLNQQGEPILQALKVIEVPMSLICEEVWQNTINHMRPFK